MSGAFATFERELRAYFLSPLAYVVLFFLLVVNGGVFSLIVAFLNDPMAPPGRPLDLFFGGTLFFWVLVLFATPVLTMRSLAEERRSGSIEILMTSPVTELQVVLGKYLAALTFYVVTWLPTLTYAAIVTRKTPVDAGVVAAGYLGILLIGAVLLAIGIFASATTANQIVAAVVGFALSIGLFGLSLLEFLVQGDSAKETFRHLSLTQLMEDFSRGIVDTRRIVFVLSTTVFFLFLTTRALAARKWR